MNPRALPFCSLPMWRVSGLEHATPNHRLWLTHGTTASCFCGVISARRSVQA